MRLQHAPRSIAHEAGSTAAFPGRGRAARCFSEADAAPTGPREACGVFGIYAPGEEVARVTFFGLYALQHRGQESAGIATWTGDQIALRTGMGLVTQVFEESDLAVLTGDVAIGHTRYSTAGSSRACNAQPVVVPSDIGPFALAHNGNLINARALRQQLAGTDRTFEGSTDSEAMAHLIAASPGATLAEKIRHAMPQLTGAYSLTLLARDQLIGVRDPLGVRPLVLGRLGSGWVIASESCALDTTRAQFIREIEPGEIVVVDRHGVQSIVGMPCQRQATCIFEHIYFARPDSTIGGRLLYEARYEMGRVLAREHAVEADVVIAVPDSATPAGIGYSHESGIPYMEGLIKNRYIGRTFIQPSQRLRDSGVRLKFNPLREVLRNKRIVVVDDSIVRGTTTPHVVSVLRRAGAREVHLRICAPPITHPCYFGVDMATKQELIAAHKSVEEIKEFVGADSLGYISIDGLIEAVGQPQSGFCLGCFTGNYPIPVVEEFDKLALERDRP